MDSTSSNESIVQQKNTSNYIMSSLKAHKIESCLGSTPFEGDICITHSAYLLKDCFQAILVQDLRNVVDEDCKFLVVSSFSPFLSSHADPVNMEFCLFRFYFLCISML